MKKQELDYYEEFIKMSKYTIDISSLLKELVQGYDYDKVGDKVIEIHEIENMADKTQHGVLNYLIRDFVPVLDDNNVACLLDMVESKLYYSNAAEPLVAGNILPDTYATITNRAMKIYQANIGVNGTAKKIAAELCSRHSLFIFTRLIA